MLLHSLSSLCVVLLIFSTPLLAKRKNATVQPDQLNTLLKSGQYEEFGRIVQINPQIAGPPTNILISPALYFVEYGDVMLRPVQIKSKLPLLSFNGIIVSKWKQFVPYAILPYLYTPDHVTQIEKTIGEWNDRFRGFVEFRPQTQRDKNYVVIFKGNGCFSNQGRVGGIQAISMDYFQCLDTNHTLHLMMHTIGFGHNNQRADRDLHIRNNPIVFPPGSSGSYVDITPSVNDTDLEVVRIYGDFEYKSIMMAPSYPTKLELFPLFFVLHRDLDGTEVDPRTEVGQMKFFTQNDELMVRKMYPA